MSACCVFGCKNRHSSSSKLKFYRIPSGKLPFQANRKRLWQEALRKANGKEPSMNGRVCGAHFISGELSMDYYDPDFVPSVFTCTKPSSKRKPKRSYSLRKRNRQKRYVETEEEEEEEEEEETTPPRVDSPVDLQASLSVEETSTPSLPSESKEGESLINEAETETKPIKSQRTSIRNKEAASVKVPAGQSKLDKRIPIVRLKSVFDPESGYLCEQCDQNFPNVSQLVKHVLLHEEERSFICETCGKAFKSQTDFTEHQHAHKFAFSCNICDRSFTTSHDLKRHKLLHVKDGRKCPLCGVLFCQRHNHILYLPQAVTESDSNLMPENSLLEMPSQTADLDHDAQSTMTKAPTVQTVSQPPPNPGPSSKTHNTSTPASHIIIITKTPAPEMLKPFSVPRPPPPLPRHQRKPDTSSQPKPPPSDYPAPSQFQLIPQNLQLPASLKMFSPQYLTSALLQVKRNYDYILSKSSGATEKAIVKEEECELPLSPPKERRVKKVKKEKIAYDLEVML